MLILGGVGDELLKDYTVECVRNPYIIIVPY